MKVILTTQSHDPDQIKDLKYNTENNSLEYNYNGRVYTVEIEESVTSYVKVNEEDKIEIINLEAKTI